MRYFKIVALLLPIIGFSQDVIKFKSIEFEYPTANIHSNDSISLDSLYERYFDLSPYQGGKVTFKGHYKGDRIVFRNAEDVHIEFKGKISTTHKEDAIAFLGDARNVILSGDLIINGAITFWATMDTVEIAGLRSIGAHTGIRATQDLPHTWVNIHDNDFLKTQFECIYIGPSYKGENTVRHVRIHHNRFYNSGWDSAQIGNCQYGVIESNLFIGAAKKDEYGQNWTITVNPGSLAYMRNNTFINCPNRIQCLDSRCFSW